MREITVSIDVFAAIWALRLPEEQTESQVLQRVLSEYSHLERDARKLEFKSLGSAAGSGEQPLPSAKKEEKTYKKTLSGSSNMEGSEVGKIRWVDDVRLALGELGGEASLHEIYKRVQARRRAGGRSLPSSLEATIRQTLESFSSDSKNFRGEIGRAHV